MDDDGMAVEPESEGIYPAYAAWGRAPDAAPLPYEAHCSASRAFCFFCEYQNGACPDDTGADLRKDLADFAHSMLKNKQEPRVVAKALKNAYDQSVREYVDFIDSSGKRVFKPEWTIQAIERHMMFSTEFTEVFQSWLERSHQAMLVRIGSTLVTEDGRVCPNASKQFTQATKSFIDVQKAFAQLNKETKR